MKINPYNLIRLALPVLLLAILLGGCGQETATPPASFTPTAEAPPSESPAVSTAATATPLARGMPFLRPYPNATALDLGDDFQEALKSREAALLGNELAARITSQQYFTSDTSTQVIAYYEPTLFQLGYQKIGRIDISLLTVGTASTLAVLFTGGTAPDAPAVLVTTVGPLSAADLAQLKTYNAAAAKQIHEKDLLVNVFSGFTYGEIPAQIIIPDTTLVSVRPNVPLYSRLTPLDLGAGFYTTINQALVGLVGQEASVNSKLSFYRMAGLPGDFWTFYDTEMPKLDYRRAGQVDVGSVAAIGKVKSQAVLYEKEDSSRSGTMVITLGPWSETDYGLLTKIVLLAKQNLKAGDTIVIVVSNLPLSGLSNGLLKGK